MKFVILALGFLITTVISVNVQAEEAKDQPRRWKRMNHQSLRIKKGLAEGTITLEEANKLKAEQRQLKEQIREMKADGKIDKDERALIESKQNVMSSRIKLQKLDEETGTPLTEDEIRQFAQQNRIKDGIAAENLTGKEADHLRDYLKANADMIAGFKADGTITPEEQAKIDARQDIASEKIWQQRHDNQNRGPASVEATAAD